MQTRHRVLSLALLVLLLALPAFADLAPAQPAAQDTLWSRAVAAARSTPPSPVVTNALDYRMKVPKEQVQLKRLDLPAIESMRLLTHANIPLKVLMACIDKTRDEVQAMLGVIKEINATEHLPADERIKLHLVCDTEASFRNLSISPEDYRDVVEVDRYFNTSGADVWMQDWGEIAMVRTPGQKKEQLFILDTNRARRTLAELPLTLAKMWSGFYFQKPTPSTSSSGDYGGNIEVTPDGVLILGTTSSQELRDVLAKGYANRTALLDTKWLMVGHVDEYVTTIPTPQAPRGYVIVKADPALGLERIAALPRAALESELTAMVRTLYQSRAVTDGVSRDTEHTQSERVFATLSAYHAYANGLAVDPNSVAATQLATAAVTKLIEDNRAIAATIDAQIETLKTTIKQATGDDQTPFTVISLPALFEPFGWRNTTVAMLPGAANLVVLRNHVVVPDPLLPSLRREIADALTRAGLKPHFIPDASYHFFQGQLHCGTNVLRHPNRWLVDPAHRPERVQRFHDLVH